MIQAAKISIVVDANSSGVGPGLAAGTAAIQTFAVSTTKSFAAIGKAFNSLTTAQKVLGGAALGFTALAAAASAVIRPAIEFESAFAGVLKTVDGTPGQLNAIRDGLLDMSAVMPTSANELASIAENAGQLGVQAPNVLAFTETVAQLGETTDLSFDSAAQSLARFLNITGSGADGIGRVADVIVDLGNNSATTESQIVAFATRLASSFTVAGATEDQILAVAAAFSSMGLQAEAGGSSLSRIITSISDAARGGSDDLGVYADVAGLTVDEFRDLTNQSGGVVDAFLLVADGFRSTLDAGKSITPVLDQIGLGGLRTSEAFRLAALNTDLVRAALARAALQYVQGEAAQAEYNKRTETTAARLDILRNRLTAVAIAAGTPLLDTFADGVDLAGDAVARLVQILQPLASELGSLFSSAADDVGLFMSEIGGPALGVAAESLGLITGALATVLSVLGPVGIAMAALIVDFALAGPVTTAAAAGMTALGVAGGGTAGALALAGRAVTGFLAAVNPMALVLAAVGAAAIYLNGNMRELERQAQASSAALRTAFTDGLDTGNFRPFNAELATSRDRLAELEQGFDNLSLGEKTDAWLSNALGINLMTGEAAALNAELNVLRDELDAPEFATLTNRVQLLAMQFGLAEDTILATTEALGISNLLVERDIASWTLLQQGIATATQASTVFRGATDELALSFVNGTASLDQFVQFTGLTNDRMTSLARLFPEVADQLELVFSDDQNERAIGYATAMNLTNGALGELEASLGLASGALLDQVTAVGQLAEAHNRLVGALNAADSAMAQVQFQQNLLSDATDQYSAALDGLDGSDASLVALATATVELTKATAANSESVPAAVAAQKQLAASFVQSAVDAGYSWEQITLLGSAVFDLPPSTIIEIALAAEGVFEGVASVQEELDELQREVLIELGVIDEATGPISVALEAARLFGDSYEATLAAADAGSLGLITDANRQLDDFERPRLAPLGADDQASPTINDASIAGREFERGYLGILAAQDDASPTIADVAGNANDYGRLYEAFLQAKDDASAVVEVARSVIQKFTNEPSDVTLTATDGASVVADLAAGVIRRAVDAPYDFQLTASDVSASANSIAAAAAATAFATAGYDATLTATDLATAKVLGAQALAVGYATKQAGGGGGGYNATLTASTAGAIVKISAVTTMASAYARTYNATLTASVSGAISAINRAVAALYSFRSRSITITTYHRNVYLNEGGSVSPTGGTPTNPPTFYADGGIDPFMPERAQLTTPGPAQIFGPSTSGRLFAEPVTGGEAYIPLAAGKRNQSVEIWKRTGQLLGVMANGGIQTDITPESVRAAIGSGAMGARGGVTINAPVSVEISDTRGIDTDQVGRIVSTAVRSEFREVARKLANQR